ncbi:MAG: hypothetical protein KatS3mg102_2590 [Planctomycetota bacterium]|nr:MAG: hypothetical protein KatS3mg102_2590 [Planctomycetota bacterium]
MPLGYQRLVGAVQEAYERGLLGKGIFGIDGFDVEIDDPPRAPAPTSAAKRRGCSPRWRAAGATPSSSPLSPAVSGLFGCPTVVNNVVTIAYLPYIFGGFGRGGDAEAGIAWWRSHGTEKSPGLMPYSISGHVRAPGVYELPLGTRLGDMLELAGGWERPWKAVIPGGSSAKILRLPESLDVSMDFEGLMQAGTMLGSAGVIVMDETVCVVDALYNLLRFYAHESCGQCTPCREGTGWAEKIVARIEKGQGRMEDLDTLLGLADRAIGKTICVFAEAFCWPIQSCIALFREEFEAHIRERRCPLRAGPRAAAGERAVGAGAH